MLKKSVRVKSVARVGAWYIRCWLLGTNGGAGGGSQLVNLVFGTGEEWGDSRIPKRSSGNLCCSILCGDTVDTWQIAAAIVPISHTRNMHIGEYRRERRLCGTSSALPRLPSVACLVCGAGR